jgi:SAM-dependent methyltransferase
MTKAVTMTNGAPGSASARYSTRDFWSTENLKFSQPHFRMEKVACLIRGIAGDREVDLLDVGCGPAALRDLLPPGVHYHGIDIAIQAPGADLVEADIATAPIRFRDHVFDIVVAQGVFEYLPLVQSRKFAEIAQLTKPGGRFILTYWNFTHRNTKIYDAHSNVQRVEEFRRDLEQYFVVDRCFPASHNWYHGSPSKGWNKAINMRLNVNIPIVSPLLGVEYVFLCSPRPAPRGPVRRER